MCRTHAGTAEIWGAMFNQLSGWGGTTWVSLWYHRTCRASSVTMDKVRLPKG